MKIKILPLFLIIIFFVIFFIFYKGLKNSNIYTPNLNIKKNIPSFKAKLLNSSNVDVRLSPNLVRSEFARFDPRLRYLKNLLASSAPVAVSLGALSELKEEPQ